MTTAPNGPIMSDAKNRTNKLVEWWNVMREACDTMTKYAAVMDRTDIPTEDREKVKAELLARASSLNRLAEEIATRDAGPISP
jgi:hypothetical protein